MSLPSARDFFECDKEQLCRSLISFHGLWMQTLWSNRLLGQRSSSNPNLVPCPLLSSLSTAGQPRSTSDLTSKLHTQLHNHALPIPTLFMLPDISMQSNFISFFFHKACPKLLLKSVLNRKWNSSNRKCAITSPLLALSEGFYYILQL